MHRGSQAKWSSDSGDVASRVSATRANTRFVFRQSAGFSIIELLMVVAVMLVVTALALPTFTTTMDAYRLHGTLSSVANLTQRCRIQAIKKDLTQHLHFATVNNRAVSYVTDSNDLLSVLGPTVGDPKLSGQVWFPEQFSLATVPAGNGAPPQLTGAFMWGTALNPNVSPQDPYFNSRGMPCLPDPVTGVCNPTTGFVYYYRYRRGGTTRWAASSISPAGRIQSWFWNGNSWGN
jgi:type II secretory pathway pseudopilin PulG